MPSTGDGWASRLDPPMGASGAHFRVRRDETGRVVITDLFIHGDELTSETLRGISIARWTAEINVVSTAELSDLMGDGSDGEITLAELREHGATLARSRRKSTGKRVRKAVSRPDGSDPETFYALVAKAYSEYAVETKAPAKALAEEAGVPTTTAHRWIREARRRGFLPPGRKGKVG